jgi:hypothetical protein
MEDRQRPSSVRPPAAWVTCVTGDSNKKKAQGILLLRGAHLGMVGGFNNPADGADGDFVPVMDAGIGSTLAVAPSTSLHCGVPVGLMVGALTRWSTCALNFEKPPEIEGRVCGGGSAQGKVSLARTVTQQGGSCARAHAVWSCARERRRMRRRGVSGCGHNTKCGNVLEHSNTHTHRYLPRHVRQRGASVRSAHG